MEGETGAVSLGSLGSVESLESLEHLQGILQGFSGRFRRAAPSTLELELRMGTVVDGRFVAGVSRKVFEQLEREMEDSGLSADENSMEIVDYFYPHGRRGDERARTRVTYDVQTMEMKREHIIKEAGESVVVCYTKEADYAGKRGSAMDACRIAVAEETPLADPPGTAVTTHVRIKQRRCFRDVRGANVVWIYELSKTWAGTSRSAVEHLQQHTEPTYEVEVELLDSTREYAEAHDDAHVANSILCKAKAVLGLEPHCDLYLLEHRGMEGESDARKPAKRMRSRRR